MTNNLIKITEKYLHLYLETIEPISRRKMSVEEKLITTTELVTHDFFEDESVLKCNDDITYRKFGSSFIIFNDLKNSTSILEECESIGKECICISYIYYTSKLLADILDLIVGNIVEITGDGDYPIIRELDFKNFKFKVLYDDLGDLFDYFDIKRDSKTHETLFDERELEGIEDKGNNCEKLRQLIFCIFAVFNIKVNQKLKTYQYNFNFAMRVGVKQGDCKITRFTIDNHIK
jgi:hypothetical protein